MKAITDKEMIDVIGEDLFQKCKLKFAGRQCYFCKKSNPLKLKDKAEKMKFIYNAYTHSGIEFKKLAEQLNLTPQYVKKLYYEYFHQRGKL